MMSNLSRRKRDEFGIFLTFFKGEYGRITYFTSKMTELECLDLPRH